MVDKAIDGDKTMSIRELQEQLNNLEKEKFEQKEKQEEITLQIQKVEKILCSELDKLAEHYKPIIEQFFVENKKFFNTSEDIKWDFIYDGRFHDEGRPLLCSYARPRDNMISLNIAFVDYMFKKNEPLNIEETILSDMRLVYQYDQIEKYKNNPKDCHDLELTKTWIKEIEEKEWINHFLGEDDDLELKEFNKNRKYYMKPDRRVYSYAVIKYKYGEVSYINKPYIGEKDSLFYTVDDYINQFKTEDDKNKGAKQ